MKKYQLETPFGYFKVITLPLLYSHRDLIFLKKHLVLGGTFWSETVEALGKC